MTTDTTIDVTPDAPAAPDAPFGTVFGPAMAVSHFDGTRWSAPSVVPADALTLHPGTHALHYGSACFEGLKAHRHPDGRVVAFRADRHVARLRQSAARLHLPVPPSRPRRQPHRQLDRCQRGGCAVAAGIALLAPDAARD